MSESAPTGPRRAVGARGAAGPPGGLAPAASVARAPRGPGLLGSRAPPGPDVGDASTRPPAERYDFHSHTILTDGEAAAIDMWTEAVHRGHRALAITDHLYGEDPRPMLERLLADQAIFESEGFTTTVGVEISMLPPRRIAEVAKAARKAGAQIVIVHGETPVEPVPAGTNHAAIASNAVDLLAHPGLLSEADAELAKAHGVVLEISSRRGHSLGNGRVAKLALEAGADLVVDSDAHAPEHLLHQEFARKVALGAGVPVSHVERVLTETPQQLLKRLGRG